MKFFLTVILVVNLIFQTGCAFKKEDQTSGVNKISLPEQGQALDSDRDGLSDKLEKRIGGDAKLAYFPSFSLTGFRGTTIDILDITNPDNQIRVTYKPTQKNESRLEYTPIKEKIGAQAYFKSNAQEEKPSAVDIDDLGVIKLSNFSYVQAQKIKNYLIKNQEQTEDQLASIATRFSLKAKNIKGLTKLGQLKVELGFIETDLGFQSFGQAFYLMTTSNTPTVINSSGDFNSGQLNMDAQVQIDRLSLDTISHIIDHDLQLALKVIDYKATTLDGSTYRYSTQVQEAASNGALFSISYPAGNKLFFNARKETIEQTLKRLFENVQTDGEGTLISFEDYVSNTTYPVVYEEGGNRHLKQSSWYLFSESDKTTDTPNTGETIMLGYFTNEYVARMGKRLVLTNDKNFKENEAIYPVNDLKIGETLKFEITGKVIRPARSKKRAARSTMIRTELECDRGGRDNFKAMFKMLECSTYERSYVCGYWWRDYIELEEELKFYNGKTKGIEFYSKNSKKPISIDQDLNFLKDTRPIRDFSTGAWKIRIKVDQSFLNAYGNSIKMVFPKEDRSKIEHGFDGHRDCDGLSRGREHRFKDDNIRKHVSSGDLTYDVNIKLERIFKD